LSTRKKKNEVGTDEGRRFVDSDEKREKANVKEKEGPPVITPSK